MRIWTSLCHTLAAKHSCHPGLWEGERLLIHLYVTSRGKKATILFLGLTERIGLPCSWDNPSQRLLVINQICPSIEHAGIWCLFSLALSGLVALVMIIFQKRDMVGPGCSIQCPDTVFCFFWVRLLPASQLLPTFAVKAAQRLFLIHLCRFHTAFYSPPWSFTLSFTSQTEMPQSL